MFTWKPCAAHEKGHRKCPTTCQDGEWVPVESKKTACDTCVARKKKCTHGLGGPKEAEIKREPDLATYQKPAGGKTKRVQEEKTPNKVSKKPASGGKKQLDLNFWDDELDEQYNAEEKALEEQYFRDGLRDLLAIDDLR